MRVCVRGMQEFEFNELLDAVCKHIFYKLLMLPKLVLLFFFFEEQKSGLAKFQLHKLHGMRNKQ